MKVFVPGTFDGFHEGHRSLLKYARMIAGEDPVVVRVNKDSHITVRKKAVPIMSEEERMKAVEPYCDQSYLDTDNALELFRDHAPCFILHGGEWNREKLSVRYNVSPSWWEENELYLIFKEREGVVSSSLLREERAVRQSQYLFPYTSEPIEHKHADITLAIASNILDEQGFKWWVSAGTALGLYRDGRLIPHDNDVDVSVLVDHPILVGSLVADLTEAGFKLVRDQKWGLHQAQLAFLDTRTRVIFDISFYWDAGDEYYAKRTEHGFIRHPKKFIDNLSTVHFNDRDYPIPGFTDEFMAHRYGETWRTPRKVKTDWREDVGPAYTGAPR